MMVADAEKLSLHAPATRIEFDSGECGVVNPYKSIGEIALFPPFFFTGSAAAALAVDPFLRL